MSTQFEKHARDEFEKHQVPIDVESLWENVYPQVKEEKKDRKFLWFFLSGFAIAGLIFTAVYFLQKEDMTSDVKTTTEQSTENARVKTALTIDKTETTGILELNASTNSNNSDTAETSAVNSKSESITTDPTKQNATSLNSNATLEDNRQIIKPIQPSISTLNKATTQFGKTIVPSERDPLSTAKSSSDPEQSVAKLNAELNTTSKPTSTTLNNVPTNNKQDQLQVYLKSLPTSPFANNLLNNFTLPFISKITKTEDPEDDKEGLASQSFLKKCTKDMRIGIGVYGGFSGTSYDLSLNRDGQNRYIQSRKESEKQLETIHLGVNVLLQSKQGLYLRTGAEYTRIASRFEYKTEERFINDSIPGIVEFRINSITNDTTEINGLLTETTIESYHKKAYNYFHLIDVPIILGYNFAYDNWRFGLEAGIYANIYLKRKGEIFSTENATEIDDDNKFYNLATDEKKWYKNNIGITPFIGLNAAYSINDHFQIHASPGFRFNKVFTMTKASPAKEKRASLGMQFGLRYFF